MLSVVVVVGVVSYVVADVNFIIVVAVALAVGVAFSRGCCL